MQGCIPPVFVETNYLTNPHIKLKTIVQSLSDMRKTSLKTVISKELNNAKNWPI